MKRLNFTIKIFLFTLLFTSIIIPQQDKLKLNLMPVPAKITMLDGKFILQNNFSIAIKGNPDERIYQYATRVLRRLSGRTGLFFPQDFITKQSNSDTCQMIITCNRSGKIKLNEDESYSLKVTSSKVELTSETDLGALRGLETLTQLLSSDEKGYWFPSVQIEDAPRFPWRGLMIDVSRHFMPVDVIKRNLDGLAALKLNVFHWHLSDDQGVRVESKVYPQIQKLCSDGNYFTQEQIKDIIKYAADRGIRVIPEFDVPGHSTAWFLAFPELASLPAGQSGAPGPYKIERNWGVFDPTFNPTIEPTYEFFDKFFGEMAALFPDEYFHIGGDENNGKQWKENKSIQEFMKKNNIPDNHSLQAYFNNRILKILTKNGKKMIGWDEILHPQMPTNIVIQSWRGTEALIESAKKGYMGILSNGYYIDLIQPAEFHYLNDPIPSGSKLSDEEKKKILGGEVTQWAELVTPENVDSRIWPRTAAIAERLWSPENIKDVEDMYRRLDVISFQLEDLGLNHFKNQEMMLRRLTNNNDTSPLKTLVDVVEPVKIYTRHSQGVKYTQQSPYTRVVDASQPESNVARKFKKTVDAFLATKNVKYAEEIKHWLNLWKSNQDKLTQLIKLSPVLKEIEPMSVNLSKVSQTGLEAVESILSNKKVGGDWNSKNLKLLEVAKQPFGQVELMVTSAIEKLINAVEK
ncbi:MAG: family 20 glycosylhydrolase [Ignavibacteriales bacterium]|nr:family 20 glycosylhydrolase [Ignavibacteriales bacterium]